MGHKYNIFFCLKNILFCFKLYCVLKFIFLCLCFFIKVSSGPPGISQWIMFEPFLHLFLTLTSCTIWELWNQIKLQCYFFLISWNYFISFIFTKTFLFINLKIEENKNINLLHFCIFDEDRRRTFSWLIFIEYCSNFRTICAPLEFWNCSIIIILLLFN